MTTQTNGLSREIDGKARQMLYQQLAGKIWDPRRLATEG